MDRRRDWGTTSGSEIWPRSEQFDLKRISRVAFGDPIAVVSTGCGLIIRIARDAFGDPMAVVSASCGLIKRIARIAFRRPQGLYPLSKDPGSCLIDRGCRTVKTC